MDAHTQAIMEAFAEVTKAEDKISQAKAVIEGVQASQSLIMSEASKAVEVAWHKIESLMKESGEFEVVLPGAVTDYVIYRTTPRESVKVVDPAAVPDEFCKVERKPKLKEIGDFLRNAETPPNWASLERGESKLAWKARKKV